MKKINDEKMATIQGGKFWGSSTRCTGCFEGTKICHETFYVLWIPFSKDPETFAC